MTFWKHSVTTKTTHTPKEAQRKSGTDFRQSGLIHGEIETKRERDDALRNLFWAKELQKRLNASKGKGKGKVKGKGNGKCKGKSKGKGKGAAEHSIQPKYWDQMSSVDRCFLRSLWSNDPENTYRDAKTRHGGRVQARYFTVERRANMSQWLFLQYLVLQSTWLLHDTARAFLYNPCCYRAWCVC